MHLLKDENGNLIPHGSGEQHEHKHTHEHTHTHTHEHDHANDHEHTHDHQHAHSEGHGHCHGDGCGSCGSDSKCKNETEALLTYMLQHNEHHAVELDQMAENLVKLGMTDAAEQIKAGVSEFQKGNMRLSLALTLVKEHLKGEA